MKQYSFFCIFNEIGKVELPYASVHNVKLQDNSHLAPKTTHSLDVKKAALTYPDPASLFGYSDDRTPVVAMQLL